MSNLPLEIEYKFLIEMPSVDILRNQPEFKELSLTQMYLSLPQGLSPYGRRCRIRKSVSDDKTTYFKTFKSDINHLKRIEIEEEISEEEYIELSSFILDSTSPVSKRRLTFSLYGYTYEVDIFPFWCDKAFLEIEVKSEDDLPPVPDFLKVIKDVTKDKTYRNSSIARMLFEGSV